jgi:Family of unknown function (DUF6232)
MHEAFLFNDEDVSITEHVARFGATSYQVSNIVSVAVFHERKLSRIAIFLFLAGLGAAAIAYFLYQASQLRGNMIYAAGVSVALILLSLVWQHMWPVYDYRFVLKTANNEVQTIASRDRDTVFRLKAVLEEAFARRPMAG